MVVRTATERVAKARRLVLELLLADHPSPCAREREREGTCELERHALRHGPLFVAVPGDTAGDREGTSPRRDRGGHGGLHPVLPLRPRLRRRPDNMVIGIAQRGLRPRSSSTNGKPMGESTCVTCGECVQACPTGR